MEWDLCKENAAPSVSGRNAAKLSSALSASTSKPSAAASQLASRAAAFEAATSPASLSALPDPLVPFLSHVNFLTESAPSDTGSLFLALEKATRTFLAPEAPGGAGPGGAGRYLSDPRYVRLCIMYCDKTSSPLAVFKFLHDRGVGRALSLFWIAWAWVAEKGEDYKLAEKIFKKATEEGSGVEPRKVLESRYKQFVRRMSRHWLKKAEEEERNAEDPDLAEAEASRPALSGMSLAASSTSSRQRSRASQQQQQQQRSLSAPASADPNANPAPFFEIFDDAAVPASNDDSFFAPTQDPDTSLSVFATEADRAKENTGQATKWNDPLAASSHAPGTAMDSLFSIAAAPQSEPAEPAFAVFEDPVVAGTAAPSLRSTDASASASAHASAPAAPSLKARGKEDAATADLLAKDPLRYLEKPEKEEKDKKRRSRKEKEAAPAVEKPPAPEMASEKGPKCGFSKRLVAKDKSGVERCFEEGRAANGKFNLVDPADCFGYGGAEDEGDVGDGDSDEDDVEMDMGTSTGSAAAPLAIYESPASNDLTPSGNATPRRIFGPDQAGLEEPAERASHVKQKHSRSISAPIWMNDLSFEDGTNFNSATKNPHLPPANNSVEAHPSPVEEGVEEDEDQTINTKLAMADLGIMFGGAPSAAAADDSPAAPRPLFSTADPTPPPAAATSVNGDDTACLDVVADLHKASGRAPLNTSVSVKLTNADILRQSMVKEEGEEEEGGAGGEESEDDIYGTGGPSFEVYCEEPASEPCTPGFAIFTDDAAAQDGGEEEAGFQIFQDASTPANFGAGGGGEVSVIKATLDNTMIGNVSMSGGALDYDGEWKRQIKLSVKAALQPAGRRATATVIDLRRETIPRMHARDTAELGHQSFYIKRELGRGTYGVVYLVEDTETKQILAMKVQKPIGSLAHEFLILNTLKTRLGKAFADQYLSIPTSLGIFSDGGCKLMAIEGNDEDKFIGMNLVDIVNVFQKAGEPIPELVAAHYTAKILHIMSKVHGQGRVLHCDIKPDNWIIGPEVVEGECIQGAGLKLIDFGKALDLDVVGEGGGVRFAGDAAGEDMQCPNMLDGKSWKEDADWFGLCATSHVLLFGAHLEVSKDVRGRWRCNKSIRRYWQGDLWNKFFDELLNEGGAEGAAIDFDGLLEGFRDFVGGRSKELKALLRHQMLLVKDSTLKKK